MICSICNANKSTIHIQKIFNNNIISEKHVCRECANKLNLFEESSLFNISDVDISEKDLMPATLDDIRNTEDNLLKKDVVCKRCRVSLLKFLKTKTIGCPHCYSKFAPYIKSYLKDTVFANEHIGKKPNQDTDIIIKKQEKIDLEKRLNIFISNEDYESAAIIRDYISTLK